MIVGKLCISDYLLVSNQQTSLEGLIDSKEEEEDDSSPTTFSHRVLHSSSLQDCWKSCVGLCPSPIVDLQQQIDTGATRVFTATSGIRAISKQAWRDLSTPKKKITPAQPLLTNGCYIPPHSRAGEKCVGPCPSPIVVLRQQIDEGAIRVFTATFGIGGIDSGKHGMTTGRPKSTLNSAASPPPFKADFPPG
ncbi:hypothetical protein CDAR_478311 [Caerostris darwini]|uniref:4Fe-4S ferredoxin-type domain-containing protein n=1 Tax=Caerostris darwini TaxID=1538125 RepID=A0AAV4RIM0_9ARAC|nr:hypothetical protein CDAR_478311 [Caerostris darwini]